MSSLTFTRQWIFNVGNLNPQMSNTGETNKYAIWQLKNLLTGIDAGRGWTDQTGAAIATPTFWAVDHSCNSAVAGTPGDGVDRWTTFANVVWSNLAGANSWMVIKNTAAISPDTLYWLLNCEEGASNTRTLDMWVSKVGFGAVHGGANGNITTRPTAIDEQNMLSSAIWGSSTADITSRFHVMMASNGKATRVLVSASGNAGGVWLIEPLADATSGISYDLLACAWGNLAVSSASDAFTQTPRTLARKTGGPNIDGILTSDGSRLFQNILAAAPYPAQRPLWSDIANRDVVTAINAYGTAYPTRGKIGTLADIWFGSNTVRTGRAFPGDHSCKLMTFGPLVVPWNGSVGAFQ